MNGATEWDESAPLRAVPDYPVDALTGPLRKLVTSTPLPSALVAGAGLAALASVCGPATLLVYGDDEVKPILWVPLIGPKSSAKTPSFRYAFAEVRALERDVFKAYRDALADWKRESGKRGGAGEEPTDPTRLVQDVTIEKLLRMMETNPQRAQVHDELSALIKALGQYKANGGSDPDKWLELWSGEPYRYSRVDKDIDFYIDRPVLSVCGTLQTKRLGLLGGNDDGMRPRWFPHAVDKEVDGWQAKLREPYAWNTAIRALYKNREPRDWELDGDALAIWEQAAKRWKAAAKNGENEMVVAALHKADQQAARTALMIAESLDPGAGGELPREAAEMAVEITDYVMDVWRSMDTPEVFASTFADQKIYEVVQTWAGYAEGQEDRRVSARDLRRGRAGGVRTAEDFDKVLEAYDKHYPGRVVEEPPGRHGGSARTWILAPEREAPSGTASVTKSPSVTAKRSRTAGRRG